MILARPLIVAWVGAQYADMRGPTQLFLAYQLVISSATIAHTMLDRDGTHANRSRSTSPSAW